MTDATEREKRITKANGHAASMADILASSPWYSTHRRDLEMTPIDPAETKDEFFQRIGRPGHGLPDKG